MPVTLCPKCFKCSMIELSGNIFKCSKCGCETKDIFVVADTSKGIKFGRKPVKIKCRLQRNNMKDYNDYD